MSFHTGKRAFVAGLAATGLVLASATAYAADNWRFAHKMPQDSPEGVVFDKFAELVNKYSDGDLNIKMFPNEQLGKTSAVIEQLKQGTVHIYAEGTTYMQKYEPNVRWISAPFAFDNREHWARFMNSDLDRRLPVNRQRYRQRREQPDCPRRSHALLRSRTACHSP